MKNFTAGQAVQIAEAVARSAALQPPTRGPKPPPPGVTFERRPLSCALVAPRWTFLALIAAAPLWLRVVGYCIVAIAAVGALLGALTAIGLVMMLHNMHAT